MSFLLLPPLELREDRVVNIRSELERYVQQHREKLSQHQLTLRPEDILPDVRNALLDLRQVLHKFRRYVKDMYGLNVEARLPQFLSSTHLYTGQWAGLILIRLEISGLMPAYLPLRLKPKYRGLEKMVLELSASELVPLLSCVTTCACFSEEETTITSLDTVRLALCELMRYSDQEPTYIVEYVSSQRGVCARFTSRGTLMLVEPRHKLNYSKILTIALGLGLITQLLARLKDTVDLNMLSTLHNLVCKLYEDIASHLLNPELFYAEPNLDLLVKLSKLLRMSLRLHKALLHVMLYPTTKVYEVYVLYKLVTLIAAKTSMRPVLLSTNQVRIGDVKMYFNVVPERLSRAVYRITGTTPRPDIVVEKRDRIVVVEVKYRKLCTVQSLRLSDVYRLLAYVVDVARNEKLNALVTCLEKRLPDRITLEDLNIELYFATVREDLLEQDVILRALGENL